MIDCLDELWERGTLVVSGPRLNAFEAEVMLTELVRDLGHPHHHNADGRLIWHVRAECQGRARSHGLDEFTLHTDASFEDPPPRLVALYVVREDRQGGGLSEWVTSRQLLSRLEPATLEALRQPFTIRIPAEFSKGASHLRAPILWQADFVRYRGELIEMETGQQAALADLERALQGPRQSQALPAGSLLLLDNWRTFHGRTAVKDPERHLLRVRFFPKSQS